MAGQFNKKAAWIPVYYLQSSKSSSSLVDCRIVPQFPLSISQFFTRSKALYFCNENNVRNFSAQQWMAIVCYNKLAFPVV